MEENPVLLLEYTNRQVVMNVYHEGALVERDGLAFDTIRIEQGAILFRKNGHIMLHVPFGPEDRFLRLTEFPRHYAVIGASTRVELYFP